MTETISYMLKASAGQILGSMSIWLTKASEHAKAHYIAKRLKTLRGLTVFEYVNKCWTDQPNRFINNPAHHFPGLNS